MLSTAQLLPPLSAKDQTAFDALVAEYAKRRAAISRFNNDARVARKRDIRAKLHADETPPAELATLAAELQTLEGAYAMARRGAKRNLAELAVRYVAFFPAVIDKALAHADKLIEQANKAYRDHFTAIGAEPSEESPVVAFLRRWKTDLEDKKELLGHVVAQGARPPHPATVLPYVAKEELL